MDVCSTRSEPTLWRPFKFNRPVHVIKLTQYIKITVQSEDDGGYGVVGDSGRLAAPNDAHDGAGLLRGRAAHRRSVDHGVHETGHNN